MTTTDLKPTAPQRHPSGVTVVPHAFDVWIDEHLVERYYCETDYRGVPSGWYLIDRIDAPDEEQGWKVVTVPFATEAEVVAEIVRRHRATEAEAVPA